MEVTNGVAQLLYKQPDHTDSVQANFDAGTYTNDGNTRWLTDHVEIEPNTAAVETVPISAAAARSPVDPLDWTNDVLILHFDEAVGTQVFQDSADGNFGGSAWDDDVSAGLGC